MPTYSDAEMRAIMGRALQIDSGRTERFSPEQLRAIAAELGISTQALEVALYEADSKQTVGVSTATPARRSWKREIAIAVGVLALVAGALTLARPNRAPDFEVQAAPAARAPTPVAPGTTQPEPFRAYPKNPTTKKTSPATTKTPPE